MGDTDIFSDMALIASSIGPRSYACPIGDRFTMGGKVAALACPFRQVRNWRALPLRHLPDHRPERGYVRRRYAGQRHRGLLPKKGEAFAI